MKASAPNFWAAGFQSLEKIFVPSVENHDEACWLVETAIRTRITSTRRPAPRVRTWKPRSPSGRRSVRESAGRPWRSGVTMLTAASQYRPAAARRSGLRPDLAELRRGLLVEAGGQRRVVQGGKQLLASSQQVADVGPEHLRGVAVRLALGDQVPRLVGDRVGAGAGRPDRAERQVRRDRRLVGGSRGRLRRRRDVRAGLVLDRGKDQPR